MPKVLLADDSATMQKVVDLVLKDQGYEVRSASNGSDAMKQVKEFMPDVVLAYIKLPGMNGYDLSRAIKSDPATKGIAVVLLAGAFEPLDEAKKAQSKADGKLVKPFQTEELLNALKPFVKASAAPAKQAAEEEEFIIAEEEEVVEAEESFGGVGDDADPWAAQADAPMVAEEAVEAEAYEAEAVAEEAVEAEAYEAEPAEAEAVEAEAYEDDSYASMGEEPLHAVDALEEPMAAEVAEVYAEEEAVAAEAVEAEEAEPAVAYKPQSLARSAAPSAPAMPAMPAMSREDAMFALKDAAMQIMRESLTKSDIKASIADAVRPFVQEHLEKIMYDIAPEVLDRTIKSSLTDSLKAVNKELENIIWETVPDMAEMLIKKELEKIKAEI